MKHYCKEASHLISDAFERELKFTERFKLRLHLLMCGICRDYASSINFMNQLFKKIRSQADEKGVCLPEKARHRIEENISKAVHSEKR